MSEIGCQMLLRTNDELTNCNKKTDQPHFPHCSSCFEKLQKKWDSLRTDYEINIWYPEHTGRFRTVYDVDAGEFDEITHNEYKHITLSNHQTNEAILTRHASPAQHWDQEDDGFYTVYVIQCKENAIYVGQTGIDYLDRIKQHDSDTSATAHFVKKNGGVGEVTSVHHTRTRKSALELEKCISEVLLGLGLNVNKV